MPTPRKGEKESDYMCRCVPIVLKEGGTQEQALGKCYGMFRGKKNGQQMFELNPVLNRLANDLKSIIPSIQIKNGQYGYYLSFLYKEAEENKAKLNEILNKYGSSNGLTYKFSSMGKYGNLLVFTSKENDKSIENVLKECSSCKENDMAFTKEDAEQIAKELNIDFKDFSIEEFLKGLNVELEHKDVTNGDPIMTGKIALAHLNERSDYYDKLELVEKQNGTKNNEKVWARPFVSCFIEPGVVSYEDSGAGIALLTKETIDKFLGTLKGRPVIIEHKNNINPSNMLDDAVGWVTDAYYEPEDGKYYCKGIIFEKEAMDLIDKGYSVSCAYNVLDTGKGGTKNAVEYNEEITDGEYTHLALVDNPRYDSSYIKFNSKKNKNTVKGMILHTNASEIRLLKNAKSCMENEENADEVESTDMTERIDKLTLAVEKLADVLDNKSENADEVEIVEEENSNGYMFKDKFNKLNETVKFFNSFKNKKNEQKKNQNYDDLFTKIKSITKKDESPDKKLTLKKVL